MRSETSTSIIVFEKAEGILKVYSKPDCQIELENAKNDFEAGATLASRKRVPVLADSRNVSYHSKEVRAYYASEEMAAHISAMAVLVNSFATRLVGNFFINSSKPHFPTRLFTNEETALNWLKTFMTEQVEDSKKRTLAEY